MARAYLIYLDFLTSFFEIVKGRLSLDSGQTKGKGKSPDLGKRGGKGVSVPAPSQLGPGNLAA